MKKHTGPIKKLILFIFIVIVGLPTVHASAATVPFAEGQIEDLSWQIRLNRFQCQHEAKPSSWCDQSDHSAAIKASGIQDELLSWINDPEARFIQISYMTFSSSVIAKALCDAAEKRNVEVDIYLQAGLIASLDSARGAYKQLLQCAERNQTFRVWQRGTDQWLNHAKIFLVASLPSQDLNAYRIRFTSSSANLSVSGLGLHYDNWLMFDSAADHYLARANLCFFEALHHMVTPAGNQDKGIFINRIRECNNEFSVPEQAAIRFIPVPSSSDMEKPLAALLQLIEESKSSILIAAHRMTEPESPRFPLITALLEKIKQGVKVEIVFDDDTILKYLRRPGSASINVSKQELLAYERLSNAGASIVFLDTNEKLQLFMHNKYMIFDNKTVFTGAGNFSLAAILGKNTEQYYVLDDPSMVEAYVRGWEELYSWSFTADHFATAEP
ncbi:MAG: phospholipase D-like domain-containing protein [Oligoflexus sp.]